MNTQHAARLTLGFRNDVLQAGHAFSLQQASKAGTRHVDNDVLSGDVEQVVKRQVQRLMQRQKNRFLMRA